MLHHQSDAYQRFEQISFLVKQTNYKIGDPRSDHDINSIKAVTHEEAINAINRAKNLLNEISAQDKL